MILADDFKSYTSPSQLNDEMEGAVSMANMRIATEAGNYYAGIKALEMKLPISTTEVSSSLKKLLKPEQDVVFMRIYQKFDSGIQWRRRITTESGLSAQYPGGWHHTASRRHRFLPVAAAKQH